MADVNHVTLIGRLTRDATLAYTSGGMAVCKFSIAVGKRKKQGEQLVEEASFFDIVAWGKTGESLNQYLVKGKQVAVEGELHQNRWEQEGQNRSKVEINATNIQLLGGGNTTGEHGHQNQQQNASTVPSRTSYEKKPGRLPEENGSAPPDFQDDLIPF